MCIASLLPLLVACLLEVAPAHAEADPVTSRGLSHTTQDRELAQAAILRTNLILGSTPYRLKASWISAPEPSSGEGSFPVYLVAAPEGAASTPAAVPRQCSCIFVNPALLAAWAEKHSTGIGRLSLDRSYLLVFMLLHEIGHIARKHTVTDFANGELLQLNIDPTRAKASEEEADEFAADLIRELSRKLPASTTSLTANWVAMQLSNLSWNMQAYRTLDEFGAAATGKPSVFFDEGYTHPNLAWRVLRSNHLIQQMPATQELLDSFEAARARGAKRKPIYQRQ